MRIGNILKRSENRNDSYTGDKITIGKYTLDALRLELKFETEVQQLTQKEAALVIYLYQNRNKLLKREEILKAIWQNDDFFSGRSMDVYISRLRKYLRKDSSIRIESIRHLGLEFKIG